MSKMYCIFARESILKMNGNRGKMAAQAGHAYLHAWFDAASSFYFVAHEYRVSMMAKKICLVVDTVDELKQIYQTYKGTCGVSLVNDVGLTCFNGVATTTCLGLGPIRDCDIGDDLKNLKVLI